MRSVQYKFLLVVFSCIVYGCIGEPEFSDVPLVEFTGIANKVVGDEGDRITVSIGFQDGMGDLGLATEDTLQPYQKDSLDQVGNKVPKIDENGDTVKTEGQVVYEEVDVLDNEGNKIPRINSEGDTIKDESGNIIYVTQQVPKTDENGDIIMAGQEIIYEENKYHNNYFVKILKKNEDGFFVEVQLKANNIEQTFHGRFPVLNERKEGPLQGEIVYEIPFGYILNEDFQAGDSLKFEIHIADRALNESNRIITDGIELGQEKEMGAEPRPEGNANSQ